MNQDLLTEEERAAELGLGYVMAAERLGLKYLLDPKVMLLLLFETANEVWIASKTNRLPYEDFWYAMVKKAESLTKILHGDLRDEHIKRQNKASSAE